MKIISLELNKVRIGKFYPNKHEVELLVDYNDGADKNYSKVINTNNPEESASSIFADLRRIEKKINKTEGDSIIDTLINIVVKDEDKLLSEIPRFIQQLSIKLDEINDKKDADGYLDIVREFKSQSIEF